MRGPFRPAAAADSFWPLAVLLSEALLAEGSSEGEPRFPCPLGPSLLQAASVEKSLVSSRGLVRLSFHGPPGPGKEVRLRLELILRGRKRRVVVVVSFIKMTVP